ncbi:hypothetical protein KKE26_12695 [bacterium]|nr:hypothetical protein [bacterium]
MSGLFLSLDTKEKWDKEDTIVIDCSKRRQTVKTGKVLIQMACALIITLTAGFSFASEGNESTNDVVLGKNGVGVEFFNQAGGNSTFIREAVTFNGRGDQPLTETQIVDVKFNIGRPSYDMGVLLLPE